MLSPTAWQTWYTEDGERTGETQPVTSEREQGNYIQPTTAVRHESRQTSDNICSHQGACTTTVEQSSSLPLLWTWPPMGISFCDFSIPGCGAVRRNSLSKIGLLILLSFATQLASTSTTVTLRGGDAPCLGCRVSRFACCFTLFYSVPGFLLIQKKNGA